MRQPAPSSIFVLIDGGVKISRPRHPTSEGHALSHVRRNPQGRALGINMPGTMDSLKLAHHVRGRWPPVPLIVTSGFGLAPPESRLAGSVFMIKPHHPDRIVEKFKELIAG